MKLNQIMEESEQTKAKAELRKAYRAANDTTLNKDSQNHAARRWKKVKADYLAKYGDIKENEAGPGSPAYKS